MDSLRIVGLLALACCTLLAGCTLPTAETPQPTRNVSVTVMNEDDRSYAVRITLVSGGFDAVEVTYRNGSTRRLTATAVADIPPARLANATDVRIVGANTQTRRYTLTPGSGTGATYTDVPANTSVVYHFVPSGSETRGRWGVLQCGDSAITDAHITIRPNRTDDVGTRCADAVGTGQ